MVVRIVATKGEGTTGREPSSANEGAAEDEFDVRASNEALPDDTSPLTVFAWVPSSS